MITNLRLADLRQTTAQQRITGQTLPSDLYTHECILPLQSQRRIRGSLRLRAEVVDASKVELSIHPANNGHKMRHLYVKTVDRSQIGL
jgi:hypothetical protein